MITSANQTQKPGVPRKRRDEIILDCLEQLLVNTALRDLSVEQIATAAGVTRNRFYFYFKSKNEAYAALLQRYTDRTFGSVRGPGTWFDRRPEQRPRDALTATIDLGVDQTFGHHEVLREASDLWNALPEVQQIWFSSLATRIKTCADTINRERALGVAPPGIDATLLAASLFWAGERLQFLASIHAPGAPSVEDIKAVTVETWMRVIYLCDDPDPRAGEKREETQALS